MSLSLISTTPVDSFTRLIHSQRFLRFSQILTNQTGGFGPSQNNKHGIFC